MSSILSLSGAQLRAEPSNPAFVAELARRQAKREASGHVTVAALRSWGRTGEAEAVVAAAKATAAAAKAAKPAPAPKVVAAPVPAKVTAFTRTGEVVAAPKSAVAHLHNRLCNVEAGMLALAAAAKSQDALLREVLARITK